MRTLKKAQSGAKTADSTAYFKNEEKSFRQLAKSEKGISNVSKFNKRFFENKAGEAVTSQLRQFHKGHKGYDANGFPIKKKKAIKKAVNGTTTTKTTVRPGATPDSTDYFMKKSEKFSDMALKQANVKDFTGMNKYGKIGRKAIDDMIRQSHKGEKGYDKNGFPLKKKKAKSGTTIAKAKDGMWMQKAAASIKKRGTAGKCTPITKPGCTGRAKALAKTFKKIAAKRKSK
jgi:hypothetical protein